MKRFCKEALVAAGTAASLGRMAEGRFKKRTIVIGISQEATGGNIP